MKVIIAGGRDFNNWEMLKDACDIILQRVKFHDNIEIVSGGARGADRLGEKYANYRDYRLTVFSADWDTHGKRAGFIRNQEMAEYADALIAFWDGKSRGTKNMIEEATARGLKVRVIEY